MKKRIICLLMSVVLLLCAFTVSGYASDISDLNYFFVILKHEYSGNTEMIEKLFQHDAVKRIEIISEPFDAEDEESKAVVVAYINHDNAENAAILYSYLVSDERVFYVSPDYELMLKNAEEEKKLQEKSYVRPYDINADGKVSAEDARLALRAAVGLETLPNFAIRAANYGEISPMTSFIARWILRTSVGLERIPIFEINVVNFGEQFVIGPIECNGAAGFDIKLSGDTDKFRVEQKVFGDDTLSIGGSVRCYYIFTPTENGSFSLKFTYQDIKYAEPKVIDEFTVKINHVLQIESDWFLC